MEKDFDTLYRFYIQIRDMANSWNDDTSILDNIRFIANSLNIEKLESKNTTETTDHTINLFGFILKTQLEIQKVKDPRVLLCKSFIANIDSEVFDPHIEANIKTFNKTLFDFAHALLKEAGEVEDETAWKGWTAYLGNGWDEDSRNKPFSKEHIKNMRMEVIDCIKFVAILCLILDMDLQTIYDLFVEKTKQKHEEWANEKIIKR